jgi:hypothetical protein
MRDSAILPIVNKGVIQFVFHFDLIRRVSRSVRRHRFVTQPLVKRRKVVCRGPLMVLTK